MAATELTKLILKVQDKVKDSSEIYRQFVSDKRAHFVTLNEEQMVKDVMKAAEAALGRSKISQVPTEIQTLVNTETSKMFDNYVKLFILIDFYRREENLKLQSTKLQEEMAVEN